MSDWRASTFSLGLAIYVAAGVLTSSVTLAAQDPDPGDLGWLGFVYRYVEERVDGQPVGILRVTGVYPGTSAALSPLGVGDEIVAVNGTRFRFSGAGEAVRAFDWVRPGDHVELLVRQGDSERALVVQASTLTEEGRRSRESRLGAAGMFELEGLLDSTEALLVILLPGNEDVTKGTRLRVTDGSGRAIRVSTDVSRFFARFPSTSRAWLELADGEELPVRVRSGVASPSIEVLSVTRSEPP